MSVLMEFSMFPTDKGESVRDYVARIIKMIDESDLRYQLTPMGTIIEFEKIEDALKIIEKSYKLLEDDCNRVYSVIKFDIRKSKNQRMDQKIDSIRSIVGDVNT